ncbi:MAG: hypothetical protein JWQ98_578 [Chlorobi bacterium]|nr:hypothetical protein [Chlorobiota bacterium]
MKGYSETKAGRRPAIPVAFMLLFCILCGCFGCGVESEDTIVAPSNTGSNIFGCRVDQRVWNSTVTISPGFGSIARILNHGLLITAFRQELYGKGRDEEISMQCEGVTGVGTYRLDSATFIDKFANMTYMAPGRVHELTVTTLDTAKRIVSGTFSFNAGNPAGDTVRVTEGRFDFTY